MSAQWECLLSFPMRLEVLPNLRVHRMKLAAIVANTRKIIGYELAAGARVFRQEWRVMEGNPRLRLQVLMVRNGPKVLDGDNLTSAFKPVRDAIATFFDIDDGRRDRWVWLPCEQGLGDYAVRIHLQVVKAHPTIEQAIEQAGGRAKIEQAKRKFTPTPNVRKPR